MDKLPDSDQKNLLNELAQGREVAKQLQLHLNVQSCSNKTREYLVRKIISSYEKSLSILSLSCDAVGGNLVQPCGVGVRISESTSPTGSPRSEESDKDGREQENRDGSRKRKGLPKWTQQVKVNPGMGLEATLDDGFSWRKYGQKEILGAKHPRGYYRCTHRNGQGCLATKQVQRSDDDPTIFEIIYRGTHTCNRASPPSDLNQDPNNTTTLNQIPHDMLLNNLRTGLKVITQDLGNTNVVDPPPFLPFNFPNTTSVTGPENHILPSPMNFSPSFGSNAASGSNYFSVSGSGLVNNVENNPNFHSSDSGIISAATSATDSPTVDLDFPFGNVRFDSNFTFDNSGFF